MKKVFLFGDSIVKGVVCSDKGRYHLTKAQRFSRLEKAGFELCSFARMGKTIEYGLQCIEKHLTAFSSGDLALISFGGNDCDYDWAAVSAVPDAEHLPYVPPERFCTLYEKAVRLLQEQGVQVVMGNLFPLLATRYFSWISRTLNPDNILHWLGDVQTLYRWQEYYNQLLTRLADKLAVPLANVRGQFLQTHRYSDCFCIDGIHPTDPAYEKISCVWEDALLALA